MRLVAFGGAAAAAYVLVARPWQLTWGATDDERSAVLPGDGLLACADLFATRVISIRAPASAAWPWIAQLGQGRGGFYSYDRLENVVGVDIHSADSVVPAWQDVAAGDAVHLAAEVPLAVVSVEPGRSLVLQGGVPMGSVASPYDFTWSFVLAERSDGSTRLLVRERYAYARPWARLVVEPVAVVSWLMSQKMLRGIRDRAERRHRDGSSTPAVGRGPSAPGTPQRAPGRRGPGGGQTTETARSRASRSVSAIRCPCSS